MIRVDNPTLYAASLTALSRFVRGSYYGRLVQIFLACKHYGRLIPRVGDRVGTDVGTVQRLLDDLYEKPSKKPGPSVVIIFSDNHLLRTGETGPGHTSPENIWRNNFNIQKGFGCYASSREMLDPNFINRSRTLCPHLVPRIRGQLQGATCALKSNAKYRREDHPKIFRIDPKTGDLFVYDPADVDHYAPLVLAPAGHRLPIGPLVVALYYDSPLRGGRKEIDLEDFLFDFDFTPAEFAAYFDDDPGLTEHARLAAAFPKRFTWKRIVPTAAPQPPAQLPGVPIPALARRRARGAGSALTTIALPIAPPRGGHWWDAEQAVRRVLESDGWTVVDKSRFGVGYDFLAWKRGTTRHVEVKSSAGRCSPVLTDNEYAESRRLRTAYVLAIVEDFDPTKSVRVLWVQDPASLHLSARQVVAFGLPRSQWLPHASIAIP
jgi:hypothetical protein